MGFSNTPLSREKQQALLKQKYDPSNVDDATAIAWMLLSYFPKATLAEYKDLKTSTRENYLKKFSKINHLSYSAEGVNIKKRNVLLKSKECATPEWQKKYNSLNDFYIELTGGQKLYEYLNTCKAWESWWLDAVKDKAAHIALIKERWKNDTQTHPNSQDELKVLDDRAKRYTDKQVSLILSTAVNVARVEALANQLVYISAVINVPKLNTLAKKWYEEVSTPSFTSNLPDIQLGYDLLDYMRKRLSEKNVLKRANNSSEHIFQLMSPKFAKKLPPFNLTELRKNNDLRSWGLLPFMQDRSGIIIPEVLQ